MAKIATYDILDTRDYNKIDNKIDNLSNTVNSKEYVLQTNINDLFSKHDALKAYAENNKALIDELTEDKISHDEIANDIDGTYATNEAARNVPLSAAFGGVLVNRTAKAVSLHDEEYTRATNAERALDERLDIVEHDVNTFLNNADLTADAIDTLREIQNYIDSDVEAAKQVTASIQANAQAITERIPKAAIVDNLTDGGSTKVLSAEQGKVLENKKINYTDVIDNLASTDTDKPLSANQGKLLNNNLSAIAEARILKTSIADNLTTTDATKVLSAKQGNVLDTKKVNISDIVNDLTTGGTTVPLSAEQGKVLNNNLSTIAEARILKASIADDLTTNDATRVLAASQGVVLKGLYDNIPAWSLAANKPTYTYTEVGADADGAATNAVNAHNTSESAHNDIRQAITNVTSALSERIPKSAIIDDIVNDTSNRTGKVLSAGQGDMLYALIQDLITRVDALEGGSAATE